MAEVAITSSESELSTIQRGWEAFKVFEDASTDETTSPAIDIRNARSVSLFIETGVGVNAGVVQLEVAMSSGGPWVKVDGVTTAAASTGYQVVTSDALDGNTNTTVGLPAKYARARIETAIGVGTVDAYLVIQK
jgi:hypothetical protein